MYSKSKRRALTAALIRSHTGPTTVHFTPLRDASCPRLRATRAANEVFGRCRGTNSRRSLRRTCCVRRRLPVNYSRLQPLSQEKKKVQETTRRRERLIVSAETSKNFLHSKEIITFCVSRRRRKMYCGHARLCVCVSVCLSVCLSVCPRPYAHTTARTPM